MGRKCRSLPAAGCLVGQAAVVIGDERCSGLLAHGAGCGWKP